MAGFVTWLRRQREREDGVGVLSREFIREDPERDVWTLEGLRERMIVDGACGRRYDALAQAVVEWGAEVGIAVTTRSDSGRNILAPPRAAAGDTESVQSSVATPVLCAADADARCATGTRTFSAAPAVRSLESSNGSRWHEPGVKPGYPPPDFS